MDRRKISRRAGIALVGAGIATAIPYTRGMTTTIADRLTNVDTAADPDALLGIRGIGQSHRDDITVANNADAPMTVTVQTTNFSLAPDSGTETTFNLTPTEERTIAFSPESGLTDDVEFTGVVDDGSGQSTTIQLTRSITVPAAPEAGTTYRIKNVHSGLYLTGDAPSGGGWWNSDPGDVYQDSWQGLDAQRWTVQNSRGSFTLEHASSGALLNVGDPADGNSFEEIVTASTNPWYTPDSRLWNLIENADGTYRIESVSVAPDVIDIESGLTETGANVIAYPWKGNDVAIDNQKWIFQPV